MINKIHSRGRPKEFDEHEALTAAMHYFWKNGYENTSLDNLLVAMGIRKSSFYATFVSKEEVFSRSLVLYREETNRQLQNLKMQIGSKEALLALTFITMEELEETGSVKGCLLINSGKECYNKHADLSHQVNIGFNFMYDLLFGFVQEAQSGGEILSTKDARIIAGRYMNALNGLVVTIQAGAKQELIDDLVESLKEILE